MTDIHGEWYLGIRILVYAVYILYFIVGELFDVLTSTVASEDIHVDIHSPHSDLQATTHHSLCSTHVSQPSKQVSPVLLISSRLISSHYPPRLHLLSSSHLTRNDA